MCSGSVVYLPITTFARKVCIEHYGYSCTVCDFNFAQIYGSTGKGLIHVHHLTQICKIGKRYKVNPVKYLRPVCPNCHAMLHKQAPPLKIEQLAQLIKMTKDKRD